MIGPLGQFLPILLPPKGEEDDDNEIDPEEELQETLEMIKELRPQRPQHTKQPKKRRRK